jgi:hypothetical protein
MPFTYPDMPRFPMPAGPWSLAEAATTIPVKSADGKTVVGVKYGPGDLAIARAIVKIPELLETAMWAEAALAFLAITAKDVDDRAEFGRRHSSVRELLNAIRV